VITVNVNSVRIIRIGIRAIKEWGDQQLKSNERWWRFVD
jgi:hypothetical protein